MPHQRTSSEKLQCMFCGEIRKILNGYPLLSGALNVNTIMIYNGIYLTVLPFGILTTSTASGQTRVILGVFIHRLVGFSCSGEICSL